MARKKKNTFDRDKMQKVIEASIIKRYGKLSDEYLIPMTQLLNNMEIQAQCLEYIREHGIIDSASGKRNELLPTLTSLEGMILKYSNDLGLTLKSNATIKEKEKTKNNDSDLLKTLISD